VSASIFPNTPIALAFAACLAFTGHAQTATSVDISGGMTISVDLTGGTATSTINGSGTVSPFGPVTATASGTVTLSECVSFGFGGGGVSIGTTGIAPANFTLDFGAGNTMTGHMNLPCSALVTALNGQSVPSSGTGAGSVTVTGGTGKYAAASGSFPSVNMTLTITGGNIGPPLIYNCTAHMSGNGTVTVPGGGPIQTTAPVGANPAFGSASSQSMQFTFTDPRGAQDLDVVNVLINNVLDGRNACYLAYSRSSGVLYLVADNGGTLMGLALNGSGSVSNSQCTVAGAGASASLSGNNLVLTLNLSFSAAFAGNRILYMAARDLEGGNSGWHALGVWAIPGSSTFPSPAGATPSRSTGSAQTLTFIFTDSKGAQDLGVVNALINNSLDGRQACYIAYSQPSKVLYLVGDAGGGLSGGLALGGSGTVSNSQCTVSASGSSATVSGNTLTLVLKIAFTSAFDGDRVIYLAARDSAEANNSGWQALATSTVQ
jgi:hypothetical protein